MSSPMLSVVVVTYRREQILCDTLSHLLALDYPDWELIVVDQTPQHEPETQEYLRAVCGKLRYLHTSRIGMCHARNLGIAAARGDAVIFVDDDVDPGPDLLARHARHYADETVGGVTGPTSLDPSSADGSACQALGGEMRRLPLPNVAVETDGVSGCNMSFRRQALLQIGGFDEGYILRAHREETDVSLRVRALGYRLLFDPHARVEHLIFATGGSRASQAEDRKYVFGWYHNNAYFFAKHVPLWQLPVFLRYQFGLLLYRQMWQQRRPELLRPALSGLMDGFRKGRAAGREMRTQPVYASL